MKGSWLAGIILILHSFGQPVADAPPSWHAPPAVTQIAQQLEQAFQEFENDCNKLLDLVSGKAVDLADFNRQLEKVEQDFDQIQRAFLEEKLAHRAGIRQLPKTGLESRREAIGSIQVAAGDRGVSAGTVHAAAGLIRNMALPVIEKQIGHVPAGEVRVVLFSTERTYANALLRAGIQPDLLPEIVAQTGGVTVGSDIWIPLYALQDQSDLANVLTHELTHVVLNQMGLGERLPTWINEGIAWFDGREAQNRINPGKVRAEERALSEQLNRAVRAGALVPLSSDTDAILQAPYNVEWQDYLAVDYLIRTYGPETFKAFLNDAVRQGPERSFAAHYPMTLGQYEASFQAALAASR
ncbi:MAG: peptidase MA family metallohydrolase [Alicyclobacillaceae bacterium]|nr:peptidase MA family metallohydrolase [Alicyclobacillaceae bacterium]